MEAQGREEVKKIIIAELPELMKVDPDIRNFILNVTRESYPSKRETESRFDRIMDELKRDREARDKKWESQEKKWEALEKKWEGQEKKWEALEKKWEDQDKKWESQEKKWEGQEKKWESQDKKWEAQEKKWEAQEKKWEAQEKKWEGQEKKWEAQDKKWEAERRDQNKKWEENQRVINEMLISIQKLDKKHESTIGALGARWGLNSESAFRKGLRAILEGSFGVKVERYEDYDHEGTVFGRPEQVELDVIIHNGTLILCEIKSSMSKSDMYSFWRKKNFYEKKHDRKTNRIMVISPMIDDYARSAAKDLDIEVYGYADSVKL